MLLDVSHDMTSHRPWLNCAHFTAKDIRAD